jgi:hypothetical protein
MTQEDRDRFERLVRYVRAQTEFLNELAAKVEELEKKVRNA